MEVAGSAQSFDVKPLANRFAEALFARLKVLGVDTVIVSPGARSAPLAAAVSAVPGLRCLSVVDERTAGFMALGFGIASGRPAVLVCTSGSAVLHYLPALAEAKASGIPLWIVAADRPQLANLIGAPQTLELPDTGQLTDCRIRIETDALAQPESAAETILQRILAEHGLQSTVLLQIGIDEPLSVVASRVVPSLISGESMKQTKPSGASFRVPEPLTNRLKKVKRGVIYAGASVCGDDEARAIHELAAKLGFVLLADAAHPARYGTNSGMAFSLNLSECTPDDLQADLILRTGAWPANHAAGAWLGQTQADHIYIGGREKMQDPFGKVTERYFFCFSDLVTKFSTDFGDEYDTKRETAGQPGSSWLKAWQERTDRAACPATGGNDFVAAELVRLMPADSVLMAGNSSVIRALDRCTQTRKDLLRVHANRGVNGIEGLLATAAGIAMTGVPVLLWLGDLALLHDLGSLAEIVRQQLPVSILVSDDGGGRIFGQLPMAEHWNEPTRNLVCATHRHNLLSILSGFGLRVAKKHWQDAVSEILSKPGVVLYDPDEPDREIMQTKEIRL